VRGCDHPEANKDVSSSLVHAPHVGTAGGLNNSEFARLAKLPAVTRGFLYPFGHSASLIKITESRHQGLDPLAMVP